MDLSVTMCYTVLMYVRFLQSQIEKRLFSGKVIVIYGSRQTGKTTLAKSIIAKYPDSSKYLNADFPNVASSLSGKDADELKSYIGNHKIVVIDEAQRVENIGLTLKILVDNFPEIQIIATGSSSFELANSISEPLTGRAWMFQLLPLSFREIIGNDNTISETTLDRMLRYGSYPAIWMQSDQDAEISLYDLSTNFLFKDIFTYENLRKAPLLSK
jgi:uncharacterized protein